MTTTDQGQTLHDRLTRGEKLIAEEQHLLAAWYHKQDRAESELLEQQGFPVM